MSSANPACFGALSPCRLPRLRHTWAISLLATFFFCLEFPRAAATAPGCWRCFIFGDTSTSTHFRNLLAAPAGLFGGCCCSVLVRRFEKSLGNLAFRGESLLLSLRRASLLFLRFLPRRTIRRGVAALRHFFRTRRKTRRQLPSNLQIGLVRRTFQLRLCSTFERCCLTPTQKYSDF